MESNKLFTYDRLKDFVNNYTEYIEEKKVEQQNPETENYKYYQFEASPDGIPLNSLGRFKSDDFYKITMWRNDVVKNGIDAWKINLAKMLKAHKKAEKAYMNNGITNGNVQAELKCICNQYSDPEIINARPDGAGEFISLEDEIILLASEVAQNENNDANLSQNTYNGVIPNTTGENTTNYMINTGFSQITGTASLGTIDLTGMLKLPKSGQYRVSLLNESTTSEKTLIWIGEQALAEYTVYNSTITSRSQNKNYDFFVEQETYLPIRIQQYLDIPAGSGSGTITANINLQLEEISENENGTLSYETLNINECLYYSTTPLFVLYCAFISNNQMDFISNEFLCYSTNAANALAVISYNSDAAAAASDELAMLTADADVSAAAAPYAADAAAVVTAPSPDIAPMSRIDTYTSELNQIYKTIRKELKNAVNGKYDYNNYNRVSYGVLPDNIEYTQNMIASDGAVYLPYCYSIYRLNNDPRFGSIYQISTTRNNSGAYTYNKINDRLIDSILEYDNSYREKPGYYPNLNEVSNDGAVQNVPTSDGMECKDLCNDSALCGHYYTFAQNGIAKCLLGTDSSMPYYNTVPHSSIDPGSSSLNLRNFQIDTSSPQGCDVIGDTNIIPITMTNNYSDNFRYSRYSIVNEEITQPQQVGICGDASYNNLKNEAYDILYNNAMYFKDGTFVENFIPNQKVTHGIRDTNDAIRTNLHNETVYAKKMEDIDENYNVIKEKIPTYEDKRQMMTDDPKYDYAGDELLYFRNKLLPDVRKKRIMDNNETFVNAELLYALGTVSAVTLIVFAIVLARD